MSSGGTMAFRSKAEWWLVTLFAVLGLGLGAWGAYEYAARYHPPASVWSAFYFALQLFLLHTPHLDHEINAKLELGRWFAAAAFLLTARKALVLIFYRQWKLLFLPLRKGHVVICGLGRLGQTLAQTYSQQKIVVIEKHSNNEAIDWAWSKGIVVLVGDACDPKLLKTAGVTKASQVFVACGDDQTNVAVLSLVGELVQATNREVANAAPPKLTGWAFIQNAELRSALKAPGVFPGTGRGYAVNIRGMDLYEVSARHAFEISPLDHTAITTRCHLIIYGFGQMGEAMALQAARLGHFANGQKLRLTLVDERIEHRWREFEARYETFRRICDVEKTDAQTPEQLAALVAKPGAFEVTTIVICRDEADEANLAVALRLANLLGGRRIPILVYLSKRCGFPSLFAQGGKSLVYDILKPFGMVEDACSRAALQNEKVARELHESYLREMEERRKKEPSLPRRPAEVPWEQLAEQYKESNRQAVEHIPIKAGALGYHIDALAKKGNPIRELDREHKETLARMEHNRWCAEKWLDGWRYGDVRDDARRRHPDLRDWDDLPDKEQRIDQAQIAALADALKADGRGFFR